jgi:hypothetical protein
MALIQPRQLGWHATQLNFIGSFRSSSVEPASAPRPTGATTTAEAMQNTAVASSRTLRNPGDFKSLKMVPSPSPEPHGEKPGLAE